MAREGEHNAKLTVRGDARSADKEMRSLAKRVDGFEKEVQKTNRTLAANQKKLQGTTAAAKQTGGAMAGLKQSFGGIQTAVLGAAGAAFAIDTAANRMVDVSNAAKGARFDMAELSAAVDHQTTQFELSTAASTLAANQYVKQADATNIMAMAATHADATGRDLVGTQQAIAKALATGNADRLRAIGLNTDLALKLDQMAKATGRSTTQITLAERQQLALAEVTRALGDATEDVQKPVFGLGHSFVSMKNQAIDAMDEVLVKINSIPQAAERPMRELSDIFGMTEESTDGLAESLFTVKGNWASFMAVVDASLVPLRLASDGLHELWVQSKNLKGEVIGLRRPMAEGTGALQDQRRKAGEAAAANAELATAVANNELAAANSLAPLIAYAEKLKRVGKSAKEARVSLDEMSHQLANQNPLGLTADPAANAGIDLRQGVGPGAGELQVVEARERAMTAFQAQVAGEREGHLARVEAARIAHADLRQIAESDQQLHRMRLARAEQGLESITQLSGQTSAVVGMAVQAQGASAERIARLQNRALGIQALGIGALETVKAAAAFASFNYVQGALHTAAAALAFTQGGLLLSGALDRRGGTASGGASAIRAGRADAGGPAANTGPGARSEVPVPPSPPPTTSTTPTNAADTPTPSANTAPSGGDTHFHYHGRFIDKQAIREITEKQREMARTENLRLAGT